MDFKETYIVRPKIEIHK